MSDSEVNPRELIYNGSMGNTHSKVKHAKGKKSRTKILYRPGKQDSILHTTEGANDPTLPSAWFSLPDVTDDIEDKSITRIRANSLDAGILFCLENPEALNEPLIENGIKHVEVTLPKRNAGHSDLRNVDENHNQAYIDKDIEGCAEDKEIVKIIKLASNHKKTDDKNNSSKLEIVVNSPQETLLKQYLREIRVSKQNISSITQVTSESSTVTKASGSLQESQRLQISRSTPNLIEFDKPLTIKQDSAESLPKLIGTDPFESPLENSQLHQAPKKYPRTFEYDRNRLQLSSETSAFVSTKVHHRRHTENKLVSSSVGTKPIQVESPQARRPVSLYQDPPRSNYQKRYETNKKERNTNHSMRPISAPTKEVRYRNPSHGLHSNIELRNRRQQISSYPNIQPADLDELLKRERHQSLGNTEHGSPKQEYRDHLAGSTFEYKKDHSTGPHTNHNLGHSTGTHSEYKKDHLAVPKTAYNQGHSPGMLTEYKKDQSTGMNKQSNNLDSSRQSYNSNEELNLWRASREKTTQQDQYRNNTSTTNSLERRRLKPQDTFTYSSQTLKTRHQSNMNGFYHDLELSPNYNTTGRIRRIHRDDGAESPANSWSERSGSSTTPHVEKRERIVKHTSWEDQSGLSPLLRLDRSSKSPMTSHGSGSPHSSHSDPHDHELIHHSKKSPRGDLNGGVPKAREEYHRLDTGPMLMIPKDINEGYQRKHENQRGRSNHQKERDDHQREHVQPHAKLIEKNLFTLCEKIDLNDSGLWEVLLAKGIITRRKCDKIKARYPEESDQVKQVLRVLEKCSGEDFKAFKAALEATGQGHVVNQLLLSTAGSSAIDRWRIALARYYLEESRMSDLPLYPLDNNWKAGEIKRYYTRTTFVDVTARGSFTEERAFDMYHQLFVNRGLPLNRVALAGQPGSGKSVLARKMTVDWAQGVLTSYLSAESPPRGERDVSGGSEEEVFLRNFKLLVYVDLENLSSSVSVRDLLLHRIKYKDQHDCSGIDSYLRDHQRECLLIFDGWDAFQSKTAPALGLIAQGRAMQNTPVLFTYRTECECIPSAVERTFEIRGFDEEQAREYIVKLLYSQGQQSHINKLTGFISKKRLWDKYSSPDALNLLCFAFSNGKNALSQTKWKMDI